MNSQEAIVSTLQSICLQAIDAQCGIENAHMSGLKNRSVQLEYKIISAKGRICKVEVATTFTVAVSHNLKHALGNLFSQSNNTHKMNLYSGNLVMANASNGQITCSNWLDLIKTKGFTDIKVILKSWKSARTKFESIEGKVDMNQNFKYANYWSEEIDSQETGVGSSNIISIILSAPMNSNIDHSYIDQYKQFKNQNVEQVLSSQLMAKMKQFISSVHFLNPTFKIEIYDRTPFDEFEVENVCLPQKEYLVPTYQSMHQKWIESLN